MDTMLNYTFYVILIVCLSTFNVQAQLFGEQQVIANNETLGQPRSVVAVDMDADGDLDILASDYASDTVLWYENIDGNGNFATTHIVTTTLVSVSSSFPADLDGDGDLDILAAGVNDGLLVWYENLDGSGTNFSSQRLLYSEAKIREGKAYDLDGDTDNDVVSISFQAAKISWAENLDGAGNFSPPNLVADNAFAGGDLIGADLDGDGDVDLAAAIGASDTVTWYENLDGLGTFSPENIVTTNTDGVLAIMAEDMDGDGDRDLISAGLGGTIYWYENLDAQGDFSTERVINEDALFCYDVWVSDIDNDGDKDILSSSGNPDDKRVFWQENLDSLGNFGDEQIIFNDFDSNVAYSRSISTADFDNDGDLDLFYSLIGENEIVWHENLTILSTEDYSNNLQFTIYPNPTKDTLTIKTQSDVALVTLTNTLGQEVTSYKNTKIISIENLPIATYFIKVIDVDGKTGIDTFIKQ